MLNDSKLQRHQSWISAISASFDTAFDPWWQHAGHVWIAQLMETVPTGKWRGNLDLSTVGFPLWNSKGVKSGVHSKYVEMYPFQLRVLFFTQLPEWWADSLEYIWSTRQMWTNSKFPGCVYCHSGKQQLDLGGNWRGNIQKRIWLCQDLGMKRS